MRNTIIIITAVFIIAAVYTLFSEGTPESRPLTYPELAKIIEEKKIPYILIDVRTPEEYASGHIPTAVNIPYDIIAANLPTQDKKAYIIVYCRSGRRSAIAQKTLADLGYTNVSDFGGIGNWKGELVK